MSFSTSVVFFSKFVCSALRGVSSTCLLGSIRQTLGAVTQRSLSSGGTQTCSEESEKTPLLQHMFRATRTLHISLFCREKPLVKMGCVVVLSPAGNQALHTCLLNPLSLPPSPCGMGRRIKVKLICWDKSRLIIENKVKYSKSGIW